MNCRAFNSAFRAAGEPIRWVNGGESRRLAWRGFDPAYDATVVRTRRAAEIESGIVSQPPDRTPSPHEPHWLYTLWTLRKVGKGQADCELWFHPLGRELRLTVNQDLLRSQVFKGDDLGWVELTKDWQRAFEEKHWIKAPNSEVVGEV